ncbi:hypothetical protein VB779_22915 [Haloarculaceae archaeon H-GB11]|nr:hypothetical protein [Haloarculaceae archaeon H-GB1-1]MEA5389588.1 hypothetical protein [Haloarculaceae archaeon H-GB11]
MADYAEMRAALEQLDDAFGSTDEIRQLLRDHQDATGWGKWRGASRTD